MIHALIGQKKMQTQKFLSDGTRIPVTEITLSSNPVISLKTTAKDGYDAVQIGLGTKKHPTKQLMGHTKGANVKSAPQFLREVRFTDTSDMPTVGDVMKAADVFKAGDMVDVIGISKGKGYAGGVKRWGFKGGPRTHGQSDRERAPGSIGQTTTPGRVYKGKKMAGRMGHERVTVRNLSIVAVLDESIWIKGLVPGGRDNLIYIKKTGEDKKFVPLLDEPKIEPKEVTVEEVVTVEEKKEETENAK
ncbi:MAG: 50S ribosomal protein L3 [Candidatus Levybacteria bacterium]|nr:50S ribosomal protein L3 [Candidatus Levybacteria bacterium]